MAKPRNIVDPPVTAPLPYGLMTAVELRSPGNTHWMNGVTYQTHCGHTVARTYDECIAVTGTGSPPEPSAKESTTVMETRGATAFTVYTEIVCSPVGMAEASRIAEETLDQLAPRDVETAFWSGVVDSQTVAFPHLAADAEVDDDSGVLLQTAATVVTGGVLDITCGLGLLEQELAECYGRRGVIHVSRKLVPVLAAHNLIESRGPQLFTKNGNLVAVGSGYLGTSPAGVAAGACDDWMYATGAVFMYAGPVRIPNMTESFDRAANTVSMLAERTYVVGWDCCHLAVQVSTETA